MNHIIKEFKTELLKKIQAHINTTLSNLQTTYINSLSEDKTQKNLLKQKIEQRIGHYNTANTEHNNNNSSITAARSNYNTAVSNEGTKRSTLDSDIRNYKATDGDACGYADVAWDYSRGQWASDPAYCTFSVKKSDDTTEFKYSP